jgi:hypothetical protein
MTEPGGRWQDGPGQVQYRRETRAEFRSRNEQSTSLSAHRGIDFGEFFEAIQEPRGAVVRASCRCEAPLSASRQASRWLANRAHAAHLTPSLFAPHVRLSKVSNAARKFQEQLT